ncbi:site-specific integrase [Bacillus infantis]|uniref:tyrosine-type recombinase/integrase n=1 Tax=Bacillus infantis TaxID=324767 RepID=UPI002FBDAF5D
MERIFPDYVQGYFEELNSAGKGSSTLKQYSSDIGKFLSWLEDFKGSSDLQTVRSLSDHDFETYLQLLRQSSLSEATIRRLLSVLNRLLKHLGLGTKITSNTPKEMPLRALNIDDFISDKEMKKLLQSMKTRSSEGTAARDHLIERNLAIVCLARYYGLTPADISNIRMNHINLAQRTLVIKNSNKHTELQLDPEHADFIRVYRSSIDKKFRPRLRTNDPLFVAFMNSNNTYRFDNDKGVPKVLSVRGIQKMIKTEMELAGLRQMSATHLRNQSILDKMLAGMSNGALMMYFRLTDDYSLHRYRRYLKDMQITEAQK